MWCWVNTKACTRRRKCRRVGRTISKTVSVTFRAGSTRCYGWLPVFTRMSVTNVYKPRWFFPNLYKEVFAYALMFEYQKLRTFAYEHLREQICAANIKQCVRAFGHIPRAAHAARQRQNNHHCRITSKSCNELYTGDPEFTYPSGLTVEAQGASYKWGACAFSFFESV